MMRSLRLSTVGGVCAILTVVAFLAGGAMMATSGVDTLIPETGAPGRGWVADVDAAGAGFFLGAWLIIVMGLLATVALVSFYDPLRDAGPALVLAPALTVLSLTLVTVSHLLPIALADQFVPAYSGAGDAGQAALGATFDTLTATSLVTNLAGDLVLWGVVVPMYSVAILTTRAFPRWIGWLGLVVALLGGWLGVLSPFSSLVEGISSIGFLAFFVFMLSMGVAMLRVRPVLRMSARPAV